MKIETDLKAGCDDCGSNGSDVNFDADVHVDLDATAHAQFSDDGVSAHGDASLTLDATANLNIS